MKPEKEKLNEVNSKTIKERKKVIVPIILLLTSIVILLISIALINNGVIEVSKIIPNSIMADTQDIGTNVVANFDSSTGELSISTSDTGASYEINKQSFRSFIETCGINNIRTITFLNEIYAPEDSSELFKDLTFVTGINNINNLNTSNVTNMSSMFENSGLTIIDLSNWDTSNVVNMNSIFNNCLALLEIHTPELYSIETVNFPTSKWYNASDINDNNIYSNYNDTTFTTGSVHLKKLIDYNISYVLDEDIIIDNPTTYNALSSITLNNPTKTGYTFTGWTLADGGEKQVTVSITPRTLTGDLTYTANWERIIRKYTITYELDGGIVTGNPTEIREDSEAVTLVAPTKEGYTFIGWTGANGETPEVEVTIDPATVTEDLTYTANWERITDSSYVVVHHYIYNQQADTEQNKYTTQKLVEDEIKTGKEGQEYSTNKSNKIPLNYTCINEEPDGHTGIMTNGQIEVCYYYSLTTPTIENNIEVNANISQNEPNSELILTKEDSAITYNIRYNSTIKNYIGNATIDIVDTLPANIDVEKSELADGYYDEQKHTITWTEQINDINTFVNGNKTKEITKQITIVYKGQDVTQDLVNTVVGNTKTYYPEAHLNKGEEVILENSASQNNQIKQEYKTNFKLMKIWDDNQNEKNKRPESVTVDIRIMPNDKILTKELNEENGWTYEERGLIKYNDEGEKITYQITERETNEGDLVNYEEADIEQIETQDENATNYTTTITNTYKKANADLNTEITIQGKDEIQTEEEIEYTINIKSEIEDYIGGGKVTIEKRLPYEIDLEKSDIGDGYYNKEKKMIIWEFDISNINFRERIAPQTIEGQYNEEGKYIIDITKQIKLAYIDIDLEQEKMETEVKAKIELFETEEIEEKVQKFSTNINVPGRVIVKYVDKTSGEEIAEKAEIVDKIGKEYTSEKKEINGYKYIESTNNEAGKIKEEDQEVIYYYEIAKSKVTVKYQDKDGNKLLEDVLIEGNIGETYRTEQKEIENYKYVETKGNPEGTITQNETVIYVYEKILIGKLNVRYIDIDTQEDIKYKEGEEEKTYSYEITGNVGDEYEAEEKDLPYYVLVESTENTKGKLTEKEDTVIYSYRKKEYNVEVNKTIEEIKLNGENIKVSDNKLAKLELKKEDIKKTELIVKYSIKVKNNGELGGTCKILELIPQGYETVNLPKEWKVNKDGNPEANIELEAGESKILSIFLKWKNEENNLGAKTNTVKIEETKNPANFKDTNEKDDTSSATIVLGIKTGEVVSIFIIMMILVSLGICGYVAIIIIRKKNPGIKDIKFLKK